METLVLPPEDQLARRHYWHNSASKMAGFLPPLLTPPRSRRRPTSRASSNPFDRNSDLDRMISVNNYPFGEAASSVDRSRGVLPLPPGDRLLESFANRPASPVSKLPISPVAAASSVTASAGNLSFLQSSHHGDLYVGDSAIKNVRSVFRSENEPMQRPASSSGRYFSQMKQGSIESFVASNAENPYKVKEPSERASSLGGLPRGALRTARSLPEQAVKNLTNGKVYMNDSKEVVDKKIFKDKKTSKKKATERAFQRKALENISMPMQVTILQRPETKEAALYNLARFEGVPLSELCEANGLFKPAKAENASSKGFSGLDIKTSTPKSQHKLTRRYSSFEKASEVMKDVDFAFPNPESSPSAEVINVGNQSSQEESFTTKLSDTDFSSTDFPSTDFSKSLWTSELLAEKWAGPCYTVSPPPSSLPIPKFRLQRQRSSVGKIGDADYPEDFSSSPTKKQVPVMPCHFYHALQPFQMDTEMATKDLRRILHLDFA